jgi:predicted amidohydrolase
MGPAEGRTEKLLERASSWIELASRDEPDLIVLPETFNGLGLGSREWAQSAEDVPGPTSELAARKADQHSTYLVCPIVRRDREGLHNSALLFDRDGELSCTYDKVHPTIGEIEEGVIPGRRGVVHDADFGRLGFAICFDLNFRDLRRYYARRRARLVCFPSMYRGGIQLRLWAYEIGCYVISSTPGEQSAIVNPLGRILEESYQYNKIISRRINMDYEVLHLDYNHEKFETMKESHGPGVELEVASPEGVFLLHSEEKDTSAREIMKEFGLEARSEYFARATRMRSKALGPR